MADSNAINLAGNLPIEDQLTQQQINRQQQMAQMLMQQGQQQPQGQMVSGHYVAPSFFQYLAPLAHTYVGMKKMEQGDTELAKLAQKIRESKGAKEEAITNLITGVPEKTTELAGPYTGNVPMPTAYQAPVKQDLSAALREINTNNPYGAGSEFKSALVNNMIPKEITPYEKEQLRLREKELAIQSANANRPSFSPIEGSPYALNSRTGEIVTLKDPVTGQPLAPKAPPHIQNEITAINQQKSAINGVLKNVEENKDAFGAKQGFVEGLPMGGVVQNRKMTPEQVQARANVFNVSSAVIKERAGTAQSASEKETIMKFLPNPLDSADVIMQKMMGFNKYLQDKENGTTSVLGAVKPYIPNANKTTPSNAIANPVAAPSSAPIYATNGKTRIMSTDGGNTWQPAGGQ
jgi:hypothetical protein